MKKKLLSLMVCGLCVLGFNTIPANAEWRQNNNTGSWSYYDNNQLVRNKWIEGKYYVDGNGLWLEKNEYNNNIYYSVTYDENTGKIICAHGCINGCPTTSDRDTIDGVKPSYLIVPRNICNGKLEDLLDYKVVLKEDGNYILEKKVF